MKFSLFLAMVLIFRVRIWRITEILMLTNSFHRVKLHNILLTIFLSIFYLLFQFWKISRTSIILNADTLLLAKFLERRILQFLIFLSTWFTFSIFKHFNSSIEIWHTSNKTLLNILGKCWSMQWNLGPWGRQKNGLT